MKTKSFFFFAFCIAAGFFPVKMIAQSTGEIVIQSAGAGFSCDTCSKAMAGTYQFIVSTKKGTPAFSDNVLYEVEKVRDDNHVVYLVISPEATVMIPPRSRIYAKDFSPLEEIVYTN
jgi:hypothetical protein